MSSVETQTATEAAGNPDVPRIRTAIGVIVTRFPKIDEPYILREINELERQGQPVLLVPILRGRGPVVHEEAGPWLRRALQVPLFSPGVLASNVIMLARMPRRYLTLLLQLMIGTIIRPSTFIRTLAIFPKSVHLARVLPGTGVQHLHAHFATHATTVAYIVASLSNLTYSFTIHGPDIFVHRMLLFEKISKAKFVRTVSTFNKAFLCGLYPTIREKKIEVVHLGVNPDIYEFASDHSLHDAPRPQILSVAAMTPSRGFGFLVEAVARLKKEGLEVDCTIVGDGSRRADIEALIERDGVAESVRLVGAQPETEVTRLLGESDLFVLPSVIAHDGQMDGIPVTLMEAMAAGKPVVAAGISGIPELVRDEVNGILVDVTHTDRIAESVRRLVADRSLRERLGRAGQRTIRDSFDVRKTSARFIELLDRHDQSRPEKNADLVDIDWRHLRPVAVGIRRIHERRDSRVAEVTITDGITRREVVVKKHRENDGPRSALQHARDEFSILSNVRALMNAAAIGQPQPDVIYTVPRVLVFDPGNAALVVERAKGRPFVDMLRRERNRGHAGRRLIVPTRRIATWLSTFQRQTQTDADATSILQQLMAKARQDLELACAGHPGLQRMHERIAAAIDEYGARVGSRAATVVGHHGDFWPGNIYIGDARIEVIDFEGFREGLALEDVAHFLIHLELFFAYPLFRRSLEPIATAFINSYRHSCDYFDEDALRLCTVAGALQFLAHGRCSAGESYRDRWKRHILKTVIARNFL